ncbi:hypothetical protein AAHH67_14840 [Niallia circulans]
MAQSITDTAEKEGIMYVSGSAATSFLPYVGQAKYLKLLKGEKVKIKPTKSVQPFHKNQQNRSNGSMEARKRTVYGLMA